MLMGAPVARSELHHLPSEVRPCRLFLTHAQAGAMVKRLEQVAALVVAAGLAIVSYWLFFSWMGTDKRPRRSALEAAPCLEQPLLGFRVVDGAEVSLDLIAAHGQSPLAAQAADAGEGA